MTIVQSLWIGASLPEIQKLSISSFLAHGHQYHLYAYDDVAGVPTGATLCDASVILPRDSIFCYPTGFGKGSYSAFSNLFRYKLIFERGGWWVDTDLVCLRRFDFDDPFVFATEQDNDDTINCATCALTCPAGSALLKYCVDVVLATDKQTLEWGQIGPQLFSAAVKRHDLAMHCVPVATFNPVNYFDFATLIESDFDMSRIAHSHAVHLWNQMWKSNGADPATDAQADSLYAVLKRRYLAT